MYDRKFTEAEYAKQFTHLDGQVLTDHERKIYNKIADAVNRYDQAIFDKIIADGEKARKEAAAKAEKEAAKNLKKDKKKDKKADPKGQEFKLFSTPTFTSPASARPGFSSPTPEQLRLLADAVEKDQEAVKAEQNQCLGCRIL